MNAEQRILTTAPIEKIAEQILSEYGVVECAPDGREESLLPLLDHTVAIVVRGDGCAPRKVIEQAKELRVIGRPGVGYDSVDIAAATARGIPVVFTPGLGARAVAEGALAMLMHIVKKVSFWDESLKSGNWKSRYETKSGDMEGSTLGIIGMGRIGSDLARMVQSFRMDVLGFDPFISPEAAKELDVTLVDLQTLVERADFICVHAPDNESTHGMINRELLQQVKPGAIFVNAARGGLVESLDVLHECLEDGRFSAIALDVFPTEPPDVSHPIFSHPACLTSPHAIALTHGSFLKIMETMAENMAAVLRGEKPQIEFVVNPEVLS